VHFEIIIIVLAACCALFMAFSNGANDVANSFASAVGSKALTIKQALIISSTVTFLGALLLGGNVAACLVEGLVHPTLFDEPHRYILAMLTVLLASGTFILLSTLTGMPVSSTHSIVGGLTGITVVVAGWSAVDWAILGKICISWILSPVLAGSLAYGLILFTRNYLILKNHPDPIEGVIQRLPLFVSASATLGLWVLLWGTTLMKGTLWEITLLALSAAPVTYFIIKFWVHRWLKKAKNTPKGVEIAFRKLQIGTSCAVAFGNGANDVANSISPVFAVYIVVTQGKIPQSLTGDSMPSWILCLGGIGIVLGILSLGHKVMRTLGNKITYISNSRGFCIDYSVASVVLMASALGLPISTTHAATGAIVGAGFSTGIRSVRFSLLGKIFIAWIITVPSAAMITIVIYKILEWIFF
jgi:PiT family inorganic phosphate transporter